jgi:hypothetical protein
VSCMQVSGIFGPNGRLAGNLKECWADGLCTHEVSQVHAPKTHSKSLVNQVDLYYPHYYAHHLQAIVVGGNMCGCRCPYCACCPSAQCICCRSALFTLRCLRTITPLPNPACHLSQLTSVCVCVCVYVCVCMVDAVPKRGRELRMLRCKEAF